MPPEARPPPGGLPSPLRVALLTAPSALLIALSRTPVLIVFVLASLLTALALLLTGLLTGLLLILLTRALLALVLVLMVRHRTVLPRRILMSLQVANPLCASIVPRNCSNPEPELLADVRVSTPRSAPMPTAKDAITLLKADHRKVEDLFEKYASSRSKKSEIAKKICMELMIHTTIEEEIFYPACKGLVEEDNLDEAQVEHDGAKVLIAELEEGSPEDNYYDAKVKVLSEEIKHHVNEEEKRGGIFSQIKECDVDLKALGERIAARKEELMAEFTKSGIPTPVTRSMMAKSVEQGQPIGA
jgi:hypothetical protein